MRHDEPIFLPFKLPGLEHRHHVGLRHAQRCSGVRRSHQLGQPGARGRCGRRGRYGRRGLPTGKPLLHHLLRQAEAHRQFRRRARGPAATAASKPLPIWYFTKSLRLPTAAMLERLSMACSTSGGTETFSTMKLVISRPYFAVTAGLISGSSASPSSV